MNFFQHTPVQKRKREADDISDEELEPHLKQRKGFASLPIRTPPKSDGTSFNSSFTFFNPPAPLTPVDTSDDESLPDDRGEHRREGYPRINSSEGNASCPSTASMNIEAYHSNAQNITMCAPPPRPRFGRARSNDLVSPARLSTSTTSLLTTFPPNQPSDRIPTPVASHFDNRVDSRLSTLPAAPRHSFPPLRKFLSPMMEQDAWGAPNDGGLPSPTEDNMEYTNPNSSDVMMGYEQNSDGMSGLRVSGDDDNMMEESPVQMDAAQEPQWHSRQHSRGSSIAKLHMGYLAGCLKCEQKVPGHYSHILRS